LIRWREGPTPIPDLGAPCTDILGNPADAWERTRVAPSLTVVLRKDIGSDDSITVEDNGPGLALDVLKQILDFST